MCHAGHIACRAGKRVRLDALDEWFDDPAANRVPRSVNITGPPRDPGRRMAEMRRLAKPPIVGKTRDHPECRGQRRPWLAEPRAGRSPIHLADYRQFPTRRSDFEERETRLCQVVLAIQLGESQFVVCVGATCALFGTSRFLLGSM